jgi:hypothetical protein
MPPLAQPTAFIDHLPIFEVAVAVITAVEELVVETVYAVFAVGII